MQSNQELHQRVHRKRQIKERLRTATLRSRDAQHERAWAIVSAHRDGLSIREIAKTTDLSPSRVHQILNSPDADEIPVWLSQLREQGWPSEQKAGTEQSVESKLGDLVAAEVEALRWCIGWLEQAERGQRVVVNLRPDTDTETEFVMFDRPRVLRALERIAADLDELAHSHSGAKTVIETSEEETRARHRRRLAEPPSQPRRLSQREERAALRAAAGLPPE